MHINKKVIIKLINNLIKLLINNFIKLLIKLIIYNGIYTPFLSNKYYFQNHFYIHLTKLIF